MHPNTPDTTSAAAATNKDTAIPARDDADSHARAPITPAARRTNLNLKLKLAALGAALLHPLLSAAPYIEHLYPAGAQRGQTLEIELSGRSIDGAREVWVTGEGVTGEVLKVTEPTETQIREARKNDAIASQTARLRLTIAPDAPAGTRDLRIMADSGLSNRFRFEIGTHPEITETEPNDTTNPQTLPPLPIVVNGQILSADHDRYRFHATAGQHLLIQVKGRAIKPYLADAVPGWFQPKIALYDSATGALLEEADDHRFDPDPLLLWKTPATGDYEIEIWDAVARGRADLVYRLTLGELPYVTDHFPLGARAGDTTTELTTRGINLPGTQAKRRVTLAGREPGIITLDTPTPRGRANPRPFELGTLPETREREPNDTQAKAQPVAPPITINGRINRPGDTDCFSFTAKKGDTLVLDVTARRLGSPLDAKLTLSPQRAFNTAIQTAKAANQKPPKLTSDDEPDARHGLLTHHADPRLTLTIPQDGTYQVLLQDAQDKGGPEYAYRLRIAPAQPDYELRVMPDNLSVPAGGSAVVQLKAFRIDGFDGDINLHLEDLPPGFTLSGAKIPAGKDNAILTLTAPRDAPPGVYKPRFRAEARIDGKTVRHDVNAAEELMQAFFYYHTVPVAQSYLVVGPPPPFFVEVPRPPAAGPLELPLDTEIEIPVRLIRRAPPPAETTPPRRAPTTAKNTPPRRVENKTPNRTLATTETTPPNRAPDTVENNPPNRALATAETTQPRRVENKPPRRAPATAENKPPRRAPGANENKPPRRAAAARDIPVRVTATRLGNPKTVNITAAQFAAGETEGVVKIRVTDPKRIGTEGVLVIEGTQRAKGRKVSIAAPAIPYKILPAPAHPSPSPAPLAIP